MDNYREKIKKLPIGGVGQAIYCGKETTIHKIGIPEISLEISLFYFPHPLCGSNCGLCKTECQICNGKTTTATINAIGRDVHSLFYICSNPDCLSQACSRLVYYVIATDTIGMKNSFSFANQFKSFAEKTSLSNKSPNCKSEIN